MIPGPGDEGSEVRRLLSVLRDRPHSVNDERAGARKARVLPGLQAHVRHMAERRAREARLRFFGIAVAAVLFAFALGVGLTRYRDARAEESAITAISGSLMHFEEGTPHPVTAGDRLALPVAGELRADRGTPATLETSEGLEMRLEGGSRIQLGGMAAGRLERSVELEEGQLGCAVPKLSRGSHFAVVTPNAKVVVHGTRFTVRVDSPSAGVTRTCVRVSEGVVAVHHSAGESTLHAGDEWGCHREVRDAPRADVAVSETMVTPSPRVARRAPSRAAARDERPEGTLAEETTLLQTALAAERKGQRTAATTALMRLLSRYPESPLAPEARTVLERVSHPSESP